MSTFTEPLIVKKLDERTWEIMRAFEYHVGFENSFEVVKIPKGFVTDFATVPRMFWILFPPDGKYTQATIVHDYLYHTKKYTRSKSDAIFLEAMGVLGVPWWKRRTMWLAVRAAGWIPWNKRKPFLPASMRHLLASVILLIFLAGCSSLKITRNAKGDITDVEAKGLATIEVSKEGDVKTKMELNWWPKDVVNIYKD